MRFEVDGMYKNLFRDKDMAFIVDKVVSQKKNQGAELEVTWYKKTDGGQYVSVGINGDFFVPEDEKYHYIKVD